MDTTIKVDELGNTPNIVPVSANTTPDFYTKALTGSVLDANKDLNAFTKAQQDAQKALSSVQGDTASLQNLQNMVSGKEAFTQQQNETQGVNEARRRANEINKQILGFSAQVQNIPLELAQEYSGRLSTQAGTGAIEVGKLRESAIQANILSAQRDAVLGDLALAEQKVTDAVNLKFKDQEDLIKAKMSQLELNKGLYETLSKAEKNAWDKLKVGYEMEQKKIEEQKAEEKAIETMIIEATPNAPQSVITNARRIRENGGSKLAVAQALGVYGGDYLKNELLREQLKTERAQRAKIYADAVKQSKEKTDDYSNQLSDAKAVRELTSELMVSPGKSAAVGFGIKKTVLSSLPGVGPEAISGTSRVDFEQKVKQLKDTLASSNLEKLKGPMSDKDIEFVRNIGTALSLDMSESDFDKELLKINNRLNEKFPELVFLSTPEKDAEDIINANLNATSQVSNGYNIFEK